MGFHPNAQLRLLEEDFDPTAMLRQGLSRDLPWDGIEDFATNEAFCGQALYPRQLTLLKLIFLETDRMTAYDIDVIEDWRKGFVRHTDIYGVQPDIWERVEYLKKRGYRRFPHIQAVLGRRASKGFIGAILAAEQIAYLIALDNPQQYYGIRDGKDCFLNVGATSQTQAQRHQFADIRDVVEGCEWLQPYIAESKDHQMRLRTPADLRRIAMMKAQNVPIEHTIATLWAVALSASSVAGRGATAYCNVFDEFAFHVQGTASVKSSENIYEDWQPALGQFKRDALTYVPSSPFTKIGQFYALYQQGRVLMSNYHDETGVSEEAKAEIATMRALADDDKTEMNAEPGMLIFQGPSWAVYQDWERGPELVGVKFTAAPEDDLRSEEQMRRKLRSPEKFRVEREGQFAEVVGAYLDPLKVEGMFAPVPWREPQVLEPVAFGKFDIEYRIHVDPSSTGANFALAVGHVELAPEDEFGERWPHVIMDKLHVWRARDFPINPETGRQEIDYTQVERELDQLLYSFPSTTKFSSDQWNCVSEDTLIPTGRGLLTIAELAGPMMEVGEIRSCAEVVRSHGSEQIARQVCRRGEAATRCFTTWSGVNLECTPEHRLWVRRQSEETPGERQEDGRCPRCGEAAVYAGLGRRPVFCSRQCADGFRSDKTAFDVPQWVYAGDIRVGDELVLQRGGMFPEAPVMLSPVVRTNARPLCVDEVNEQVGAWLGYLVSEGTLSYGDGGALFRFTQKDPEVIADYGDLVESIVGHRPEEKVRDFITREGIVSPNTSSNFYSAPLAQALELEEIGSLHKTTPAVIRKSPRKVVQSYLSSLFEGDGGVTPDGVSYWSISEQLVRETQQLLLMLGIYSRIRRYAPSKTMGTHPRWVLTASGPEAIRFSEEVGFRSSRKQQQLGDYLAVVRGGRTMGAKRARFISGDDVFEPVTAVRKSRAHCYDLSVPETECYIANGVVSHNSVGLLQRLRQKYSPRIRVVEETATEKSNYERAEKFKSALNLGWVHSIRDTMFEDGGSLLEMECKFLAERNGKVYKQDFGPVTTKDLYDAVSVVVTDLLHEALERWDSGTLAARAYGSTNSEQLRGIEANRYVAGHHGRGGAWEALEAQMGQRRAGRGYQPDRTRSISTRERRR